MSEQRDEEHKPADAVTASPAWYCLDCACEVRDGDAAHDNHARTAAGKSSGASIEQFRSVALDLLSHSQGYHRISTGIAGFDRVLGGGLVRNGIVLIDGEPGIGKSTLLAATAGRIAARGHNVLYASGEETHDQVAACAQRIGHVVAGVRVISTSLLDEVFREVKMLEGEHWPTDVLIVDSAQAMRTLAVSSATGSVQQVAAVANELRIFAKTQKKAVILVSQVVKDGSTAGPKSAMHAVDALLSFGRDELDVRWLRAGKNRFGPSGEVAQFEMSRRGLVEVEDPSLSAWRDLAGDIGVAACVTAHLAKPVIVPVEALVTLDDDGPASRAVQATGFPTDRARFLMETLARHGGVSFAKCSVRVRVPVVAGEEVTDPALDLAVSAALWSALTRQSLGKVVFWGSVGLSGKLHGVARGDARVEYAERVRAAACIIGHPKGKTPAARLPCVALHHASEFVEALEKFKEEKKP